MAKIYQQGRLKYMSKKKKILATNISRPQWESVKKAYDEINTASPSDKNLQTIFKQAIIENGIWRGKTKEEANIVAENTIESINNNKYDDFVWQRYALVGGQPLKEYINHRKLFDKNYEYKDYSNTCALRMSYALNNGGMPLKTMLTNEISSKIGGILQGKNNHKYVMGAKNMGNFLQTIWGIKNDDKYFDFTKNDTFSKCIKWLKENSNNGIVVMEFANSLATGHTTLWYNDGDSGHLYDDKKIGVNIQIDNKKEDTLLNYLNYYKAKNFYFWRLK